MPDFHPPAECLPEIRRYQVDTPDSLESSLWLIDATSFEEAAGLYVSGVIDEQISVILSEMVEAGRLRVIQEPPVAAAPGLVRWQDVPDQVIRLEDIPAWTDALARGFDPETGGWNEVEPAP